jgi:thiamine biosynthesis lipoprotein ApbE
VGDSRRPLYFLIGSCFVNIILDVVLVAVLRMGVAGAALATISSQLFSAILVILCLTRTQDMYKVEWRKIRIDSRMLQRIIRIGIPAGMQMDLGAVGKGVALDEIRKTLEEYPEVSGAVISVGGSILTYGNKPEGGTWQIAVTDPLEPSQSVGVLTLDGGYCVSTSGDYERYVEVDGVRYHHILDPRTGSPARSDVAGVTIVTKDGFLSDALSTACFVLGSEEGQKLLEKYDAEGLFIDHAGTITMTEGMQQYFHLSNSQK